MILYKIRFILTVSLCILSLCLVARSLNVGIGQQFSSIGAGICEVMDGDTIYVSKGLYREGNIIVDKRIYLIGLDWPVLDGEFKTEIISVKANGAHIYGFKLINSGTSTFDDTGAIKVYDSNDVVIENNILENNYWGIYIQYGRNCIVKNNRLSAIGKNEQKSGNGIHCWKSDSLQIIGNTITGHRDGIYFEFVTNSIVWRNISKSNIRYGLHFMFSNNDTYVTNYFEANGAGVAVMYSHKVMMYNNTFRDNWGDAAFGILLKEISDSEIIGNTFNKNTSALYLDGANRIVIKKNKLYNNGWGLKVQASCMDNVITLNNFIGNSFDIGTNGSLVLNTFNENYWDKYEGYDLDKDLTGDVPYHPLSLFAVIVESNPVAMLLYRSFMVTLLDKSEKLMPSLTPDNFIDNRPAMKAFNL